MRLLDWLLGKSPPVPTTILHNGEVHQMHQSKAAREAAEEAIARHLRREQQAGRRPSWERLYRTGEGQ